MNVETLLTLPHLIVLVLVAFVLLGIAAYFSSRR